MAVQIEVCVQSARGAVISEAAGADRVELCAALGTGGLTPSIGCIVSAVGTVRRIGVHVLIRPREGDFVYDPADIATMTADIDLIRRETAGSSIEVGFVIGALTESAAIDVDVCRTLIDTAAGAPVSFHRAFDLTENLEGSLDTLRDLGIRRVLTGGGVQRAADGVDALAALVRRSDGAIRIMPGGSVRASNAAQIVAATGARDIHFRAPVALANRLSPHRPDVRMTSGRIPSETEREETSAAAVREMVALLA